MKNISQVWVGVDVSKGSLDICINPIGKFFKIDNSKNEINKFIKELAKYEVIRIGCEATGGYEKLLVSLLIKKLYNPWIIDPRRIRGFIIASGCKTKTDKIDARKITEFIAKTHRDYETIYKTETQEKLQALVNRKKDLTKFLAAEKTRAKHPTHTFCVSNIKKFIKVIENQIKALDLQIQKLVEDDNELSKKGKILESIPGIGKASAALLLSFVPELGKINKAKISALVGVCPYNNESGKFKGKMFIKGGRPTPRKALYMCALTSIKYDLIFKKLYDRLREKNKPFKVAIVAVMRKMIILANSLLKRSELYRISNF